MPSEVVFEPTIIVLHMSKVKLVSEISVQFPQQSTHPFDRNCEPPITGVDKSRHGSMILVTVIKKVP